MITTVKKGTGVTFVNVDDPGDSFHTYRDFGLILKSKTLTLPTVKTETVNISSINGVLDLTDIIDGEAKYDNRTLTFVLNDQEDRWHYSAVLSKLAGRIHGKRFKIILDADQAYYYLGRVSINDFATTAAYDADITVECNVDPFKYELLSAGEPWLWDPFDFETGVIKSIHNIEINGSKEIITYNGVVSVTPTFTCSAPMTVEVDGKSYELKAGETVNYEILIPPGENTITVTGHGTITIDYRIGAF